MDQLKLLAMTSVLTLLVWTAADSLVNQTATVNITIEPVPAAGDSGMLIRPESPNRTFEIRLIGPRRAIEAVQFAPLTRVRMPISDRPLGDCTIPLELDVLKGLLSDVSRNFRRLSFTAVQPPELRLNIDRMTEVEVAVVANRLALNYDVKPKIYPPTVRVRLRESRAAELGQVGSIQPIDISAELERQLRESLAGNSTSINVTIDTRPFGSDAEVKPKSVEVLATLRADIATTEIPAVPIRIGLSFANLQRSFRILGADDSPLTLLTQTITVSGPYEEVAKLLRGETRAFGIIQLRDADFEQLGVIRTQTPEFQLPEGLKLVQPPQAIEFKLVEATSQAGPAGD